MRLILNHRRQWPNQIRKLTAFGVSLVLLSAVTAGAKVQQTTNFTLVPQGAVSAKLGYFPIPIQLTDVKPSSITKEPTYVVRPQYGVLHLGNGPKSDYVIALDEPSTGEWKIYIDKNQNGDLTDGGTGAWNKKVENSGRTVYGPMDLALTASYGTKTSQASSSPYSIGIYRIAGVKPLLMYRESSREGQIVVDGKPHNATLVENDADGLYNKSVKSVDEAKKSHPLWLLIDGLPGEERPSAIDARAPFKIGDKTYEFTATADGSQVRFGPSNKVALDLTPKRPPSLALLKPGTPSPDFVAEKWGGGNLKLSDYKGKVVVLDFWATWCGPCQKSMPHVESVKQKVSGQDVAVLGVCVWDEKKAYTDWVPKNSSKYTFQFAFDPAGNDTAKSIAMNLFHVNGIPTTYVIDKNGNVADAIVGYDDGDKRLEEALAKLGVKV